MSPADCCRTLGVPTYASWEDIRQAYLDLVRVWHPDRFQSDAQLRAKAEQQVQKINEAYATLKRSMENRSGPQVPPEEPPKPPQPPTPPRPPRRPFVLNLDRPIRIIGLLIACLIPIAFGLSLVNMVHTAAPDLDLLNRRLDRPAILSPSRILSPLDGLAVATAN